MPYATPTGRWDQSHSLRVARAHIVRKVLAELLGMTCESDDTSRRYFSSGGPWDSLRQASPRPVRHPRVVAERPTETTASRTLQLRDPKSFPRPQRPHQRQRDARHHLALINRGARRMPRLNLNKVPCRTFALTRASNSVCISITRAGYPIGYSRCAAPLYGVTGTPRERSRGVRPSDVPRMRFRGTP